MCLSAPSIPAPPPAPPIPEVAPVDTGEIAQRAAVRDKQRAAARAAGSGRSAGFQSLLTQAPAATKSPTLLGG